MHPPPRYRKSFFSPRLRPNIFAILIRAICPTNPRNDTNVYHRSRSIAILHFALILKLIIRHTPLDTVSFHKHKKPGNEQLLRDCSKREMYSAIWMAECRVTYEEREFMIQFFGKTVTDTNGFANRTHRNLKWSDGGFTLIPTIYSQNYTRPRPWWNSNLAPSKRE